MSLVNAIIDQNQYVLAPSLQMIFINPGDCQPLSSGVITFYRDKDRTPSGLKPVYRIGGTPESPEFIPLPNPITLDMCGIFIDPNNGDEILPYYKVVDDDGNIDLYYITVQDELGSTIETLEHFPQVNSQGDDIVSQVDNFIPNGQFLAHLDLPDDGAIVDAETPIAYGNWTFVVDEATTSINFVTFERYDSPIEDPVQNPRYACRVQCTSPDPADSKKDLTVTIKDVNFMQGQDSAFAVTAYSNDGVNHLVDLIVRKIYGDTGPSSPPTETVVGTLTVTPEIQNFLFNFTIPSNEGKTIGPEDDDRLEFVLRAPIGTVSDIFYTDVIDTEGPMAALEYQPVTPEQTLAFALPGSMDIPAYDGSDIGKYLQLNYSDQNSRQLAIVYAPAVPPGTVLSYGSETLPDGYLQCDNLEYATHLPSTITAYTTLFSVIKYKYGTGLNGFLNTTVSSDTLNVRWNRIDVSQTVPPDAGTSGFTFTFSSGNNYHLKVIPGISITPGAYYTQTVSTTGADFVQLFWITVDGAGTIPSVPYDVQTRIDVLSTDSATAVRDNIILNANGLFQVPDLRGIFIRYWSATSGNDPDASTRSRSGGRSGLNSASGAQGDFVGSFQQSAFQNHAHNLHANPAGTDFTIGGGNNQLIASTTGALVGAAGGATILDSGPPARISDDETRPVNLYFNAIIKT